MKYYYLREADRKRAARREAIAVFLAYAVWVLILLFLLGAGTIIVKVAWRWLD